MKNEEQRNEKGRDVKAKELRTQNKELISIE